MSRRFRTAGVVLVAVGLCAALTVVKLYIELATVSGPQQADPQPAGERLHDTPGLAGGDKDRCPE